MNRNNIQRGGIKLRALLALCAVIMALSAFAISLSPMASVDDKEKQPPSPLFGGPDELPAQNLTDVVFILPSKK